MSGLPQTQVTWGLYCCASGKPPVRRNSYSHGKDTKYKIQKSFFVSAHFYESVIFTSYLYCIFPLHKSLKLFSSTKLKEALLGIQFLLILILANSKQHARLISKKILVFTHNICTVSILIFIAQFIPNLVIFKIPDHTILTAPQITVHFPAFWPALALLLLFFPSRGQFIVWFLWTLPDVRCLEVDK